MKRILAVLALCLLLCIAPVNGYLKTTTSVGSDYVDIYTNVSGVAGNETWTAPGNVTVRALVVGGGAGSGADNGGGGAGGMVIDNSTYTVVGGTAYQVSVGDGGLGAVSTGVSGQNGQASRFGEIKTNTSGAGGSTTGAGSSGDNGGGGATTGAGGTGTTSGNRGGFGSPSGSAGSRAGGGGGTTYSKGFNGSVDAAGNGQTGIASTILGSSVYYGGSGGGGTETGNTPGTGGTGGGGAGGGQLAAGTAGTANTGGGAGGSGNGYSTGAKGGSGIVAVRYAKVITPEAYFGTNTTAGEYPLAVQLTDASTHTPTSWSYAARNATPGNNTWVTVATTQNPVIVLGVGNWSLRLTATNSAGSTTSTQITWVNVSVGHTISADFTASNTSGIRPLLVTFADTSTTTDATIDARNWSFDDGTVSDLQNPDHTFTDAGEYQVNLTITNTSLSLVSTKLVTITVYKQPAADFSSFNTQGTAPFTTYFYDLSTNLNAGPYTYYTDFGDGNTSTSEIAIHTYNMTGTFTVNHSVTDSVTTAWKNVTGYITVGSPVVAPIASFYGGPQLGAPPLKVFFTDVSSNTPTSWNWSFGDGTFSESQNPAHWFNRSGFYRINLTVTNDAGSNLSSQKNFVMTY